MTAAQSEIPVMAGEISTRVVVGRGVTPLLLSPFCLWIKSRAE